MLFIYLFLIIILLFSKKNKSNKYILIKNIYLNKLHQEKNSLIWVDKSNIFMKKNWPNHISFDYKIKHDILQKALLLQKNNCIIDSGAHIGDLIIPLAHVLKLYKREDIILYAIEPDKSKCEFIYDLCQKNNLNNIKILNYALSDNNELLYQKQLRWYFKIFHYNSGAVEYDKVSNLLCKKENLILVQAKKLDTLVKENIIKHKIGIIHLDVEGFEKNVLIGGYKTIIRDYPYLSIENHKKDYEEELKILPKNYKYLKRINSNNIYHL